ncbi:hypothetical protein K458DRAFT_383923 [Lentithecium fluviatile CBS 122367]|uniref:Uncharacterized protein n=1 Tax=Lentithecium fluviatile CBS 122367 TaxID=1168545 RepID=A0A6G1JGG2_9PLEO|nr:hypothetical protein K458DRAFT_383923 [Lentithecium fluviatile CBS 122367]
MAALIRIRAQRECGRTYLEIYKPRSLCSTRGYFYTIEVEKSQILLGQNSCTSAFYSPILVSEFLLDDFTIPDSESRKDALRGVHVFINNRTQSGTETITGIGRPYFQQNSKEEGKNGVKHYPKDYRRSMKHANLPKISLGTHQYPDWFDPEELRISPYQIYRRPVPNHQTSNMLDAACWRTDDNKFPIELEGLLQWGIRASGRLIQHSRCPAIQICPRLIPIPSSLSQDPGILYKSGPQTLIKLGWDWADDKFLESRPNDQIKLYIMLDERIINGDTPNKYESHSAMENARKRGSYFVLLILKQKNAECYSIFTDLADSTYGMHSLTITEKANHKRGRLALASHLDPQHLLHLRPRHLRLILCKPRILPRASL